MQGNGEGNEPDWPNKTAKSTALQYADLPLHIKTSEGIYRVWVSEVVRLMSGGAYTTIHLLNGKEIHLGKNIGRHEARLNPLGFFRVHERHLVNMAHVLCYTRSKQGGALQLRNGDSVPVSRQRRAAFLRAFGLGVVEV